MPIAALDLGRDLLDAIPILRDLPPAVTVGLIATLPVIELRGAIPVGVLLGMSPWEAALPGIIGNLLPVPALVWLLDPVQRWLSEHSRAFDRFFRWLFARTRARNTNRYERLQDAALVLFVAVPLPGTGAWTGSAAAFVFNIRGWKALGLIAIGVFVAAAAVAGLLTAGAMVVNR